MSYGAHQATRRLIYSAVGFVWLIVFFVFGQQFMYATSTANFDATRIILAGLGFYLAWYILIYLLANILVPRFAITVTVIGSIVYFVSDVLLPPYFITPSGQILTSGATWTFGASDVLLATILQSLGLHGPALFYATYILVPGVILFFLVPFVWFRRKSNRQIANVLRSM